MPSPSKKTLLLYLLSAVLALPILWHLCWRRESKTWKLKDRVEVTFETARGVIGRANGKLRMRIAVDGATKVVVPDVRVLTNYSVSLPELEVVQVPSGDVGICIPRELVRLRKPLIGNSREALLKLLLESRFFFVFDVDAGADWRRSDPQVCGEIVDRFVASAAGDPVASRSLLSSIDYVHVEGDAVIEETIARLKELDRLSEVSIQDGTVTRAIIEAIGGLSQVEKLWLVYVKLDEESVRALASLRGLTFLSLQRSSLRKIPNVDEIVGELRSELPSTRIGIVEYWDD